MTEVGSSPACESFVAEVLWALQHVYDPPHLEQSPLLAVFQASRRGPAALAEIMRQAVEAIRPPEDVSHDTRAWRPYRALRYRYIEGFSQSDTARALTLSTRQLRREEKKGLERLCDYLWRYYRVQGRSWGEASRPQSSADSVGKGDLPSTHQAELQWLQASSPREPTIASDLVEQALQVVGPLAELRDVSLSLEIPGDLPRVIVQPASIRQAFLHIVTAAVHSVERSHVRVGLADRGHEVAVSVAICQGTALETVASSELDDLSIVEELCSLSEARVSIDAGAPLKPGRTITLFLPASAQPVVLAIDDNADTLQLYRRYLAGTDYEFLGTPLAAQALELVAETSPAVIVLDVMLPNMDGWEILQSLREHPVTRSVPVIVSTILEAEPLATALGAAAYLRKPVSRLEFLAELRRQVEGARKLG